MPFALLLPRECASPTAREPAGRDDAHLMRREPNPSLSVRCGRAFLLHARVRRHLHAKDVLPMSKILITSAIPYVNGVKHLGNLVGSLLPADVHARFRRQLGDEVLFICGTDDHGTPAELGALAAKEEVSAFCCHQHAVQADIYQRFGLSFDHFGRSSSEWNHRLTQHFFQRLEQAGLIEERDLQQYWSPRDNRFLPDRYINGTCPHCGSEAARGDQCDGCGALLDPADLISPRSAISGDSALELRTTRHLFLRQSRLTGELNDWVDGREGWPPFVRSLAKSWLTTELRDRCITRDLTWGIPVPRAGFEHKVFYVWFDAPIAYIAATQEWAAQSAGRNWRDWWWNAEDVRYIQFLGKDNVPFHAVSFPATLLGSGEPWKTVDIIKGVHWLRYDGGKFSTSQQRGVFTDAALDELPADIWRWWLIANAPETSDTDFTFQRFADGVNKDLADVFGNLVHRTLALAQRLPDGISGADYAPGAAEIGAAREIADRVKALRGHHEALEFRRAAAETRAIWARANSYLQEAAPWATLKDDLRKAAASIHFALRLVQLSACVAWSIVPQLSETVLRLLGEHEKVPSWPHRTEDLLLAPAGTIPSGHLNAPLVRKLTPSDVDRLTARFDGVKSEAVSEPTASPGRP
jgi:methionyl-tRNA synthetase